jgi:TLD
VTSRVNPNQMEKSGPSAPTGSFAADNDSLEKDFKASSDDIDRRVKAVFDEYNRVFNALKGRQQKLEGFAARITEHCRKESEGRNFSFNKEEPILKLNVGGEDINIRRTAVEHGGSDDSILSVLLLNQWAYRFVRNRNGRIFLNLNPAWIAPAINVMRDLSMKSSRRRSMAEISVEQKSGFDAVQSYYNLGYLFPRHSVVASAPSMIPSMNCREYMEALYSFLQPELSDEEEGRDVHLDLIHRGSRDGYDPSVLHLNCTGEYRTVVVIVDYEKKVFGGYFDGRQHDPAVKVADSSFLFSLTGHEAPEKFARKADTNLQSIFVQPHLMRFGEDLVVNTPPHQVCNSTLGTDYYNQRAALNGRPNGGLYQFVCSEIEVYRILDSPSSAVRATHEVLEKMMFDASCLSRAELSCPLHSWILSAVNRCGTQCSDFDARLIYTAKREDQTAATLHATLGASCNGKAMTVCIIKDNRGHTLGSFSDIPWSCASTSVPTANSFTFSLGGADRCHSMQSRSVVVSGPPYLISFGHEFNVKPDCSINYIFDGIKVTAGKGTPLMAHEIAVYEISPRAAVSDEATSVKALNEVISTDTRDIKESIRKMDEHVQQAELKLLRELLQIEHLSSSRKNWDIKVGLKAEWQKILDDAADCKQDTTGKTTMYMLGEVMARLRIPGANGETRDEAADDEVVSYNVGGTIIAVLRSTLVRQAPNSAFASRFSGRWSEQANEDMEDGHICLVRYLQGLDWCLPLHLHYLYCLSHSLYCFLRRSMTRILCASVVSSPTCNSKTFSERKLLTMYGVLLFSPFIFLSLF